MALINKLPINLLPPVIVICSILIGVAGGNWATETIGFTSVYAWVLVTILSALAAGGVGYLAYRLLLKT